MRSAGGRWVGGGGVEIQSHPGPVTLAQDTLPELVVSLRRFCGSSADFVDILTDVSFS
jgi:hypothetical protein